MKIKQQKHDKTMKKEIWQKILQFVITVLTALATSIGVTSCGV